MNTLFYMVGNSDIMLDGTGRFDGYFETLEKLYESLLPVKEKLTFNHGLELKLGGNEISYELSVNRNPQNKIFRRMEFPLLCGLIDDLLTKKRKPKKVILFATRQSPVHKQDTLYAAKFIHLFLSKYYRIDRIEL